MKRFATLVAALTLAVGAYAVGYSSNFESDPVGALPAGWYIFSPWGDWAPGPISSTVEPAPGGGKALRVQWGTDWASYGASSGETGYTLDLTGLDPGNSLMTVEYDFYKQNWRVWQVFGDQSWFPPGGLHMNDSPTSPNEMVIGTDDYNNTVQHLYDVPENTWIHVETTFDSGTNQWTTSVTYPGGSGGGTFSGTSANDIVGQYWFGGWAFQVTMDANPPVPYANALYIDNFSFSVVPEPAALLLLALAAGLLRRR